MKTKNMYTIRWICIGIAAIVVTIFTLFSRAAPVPGESCGLGLPPNAPGFAAAEERERAELRENGFLRVCEANLERYKMSFKPIAKASKGLAFSPVELALTPFAQFKSLGAAAEEVWETKSRFYRGFQMPDGHHVTLFEHDMSADGTNISRNPADEPEQVNGKPARLSVLQAGTGSAVSVLSWIEGRRYYELWLDANVARSPLREQLFAMAGALPRSIPACPNEIPPKRMEIGPDGMPVIEQPPAVMTDAEMTAYVEELNRRNSADGCRPGSR